MSASEGGENDSKKQSRKKKFVPHAVRKKQSKKSEIEQRIQTQLKQQSDMLATTSNFKQLIYGSPQKEGQSHRSVKNNNNFNLQWSQLHQSQQISQQASSINPKQEIQQQQEEALPMQVDESKDQREQIQEQQQQEIRTEVFNGQQNLLDYLQFYPTMLPLREPYEEAQADDLEDLEKDFIPPDLYLSADNKDTKISLRMDCGNGDGIHLQLWQFPSILPLRKGNKVLGIRQIDQANAVGKLVTYESGQQKLILSGVEFDLKQGSTVQTHASAVFIDIKENLLCHLGEIDQRLVTAPHVEDLLQSTVHNKLTSEG